MRRRKQRGGNLVVVEDHWPEGGLGDAVLEAVCGKGLAPKVKCLAVRDMPGSGEPGNCWAPPGSTRRTLWKRCRTHGWP